KPFLDYWIGTTFGLLDLIDFDISPILSGILTWIVGAPISLPPIQLSKLAGEGLAAVLGPARLALLGGLPTARQGLDKLFQRDPGVPEPLQRARRGLHSLEDLVAALQAPERPFIGSAVPPTVLDWFPDFYRHSFRPWTDRLRTELVQIQDGVDTAVDA